MTEWFSCREEEVRARSVTNYWVPAQRQPAPTDRIGLSVCASPSFSREEKNNGKVRNLTLGKYIVLQRGVPRPPLRTTFPALVTNRKTRAFDASQSSSGISKLIYYYI